MDLRTQLKKTFGHEDFRGGQKAIIDAILSGRDAFGIMPTGAGKSICYQLPALMMDGITIVISPLISLMQDQVMALKSMGVSAAYLNSSLTPWQQGEAIRRAAANTYKLIYVAPERLLLPSFLEFVCQANISIVAVDEAHCVSQWGNDFRPSYLQIPTFIEQLPKRPTVCAFTATATTQVKQDIEKLLKLHSPYITTTGYDRPNLYFAKFSPKRKDNYLLSYLDEHQDQCGIVYCQTRKNVDKVALMLSDYGFSVGRYHAGLSDEERKRCQADFSFGNVRVMVATNAFGMGIDKSDVRYVIHYNMPKDIESYYQEAGRAGRDGAAAECIMLYNGGDYHTAKWMIEHSEEHPDFNEAQRAERVRLDMRRLNQIMNYVKTDGCMRNYILRYFGEKATVDCGNCSVCLGEDFEPVDEKYSVTSYSKTSHKKLSSSAKNKSLAGLNSWQLAMIENLKELRRLLANHLRIPAYMVFTDATLIDMVVKHPKTNEEFAYVSGVGQVKQEKFSGVFLSVLCDGLEPNEALFRFMLDVY